MQNDFGSEKAPAGGAKENQMAEAIADQTPIFTDKDFILALCRVVEDLARKTVDQSFSMKVGNDQGDFVWVDASLSRPHADVVWLKPTEGRPQLVGHQE